MGIIEFLILVLCVVLAAACVIWAINYFAPSPVPAFIPKIIWGLVIVVLLFTLLSATGILGHDIQIPRLR